MPIATLDFASLYPSIMMAHNLCYTTLLTKEVVKEWVVDIQRTVSFLLRYIKIGSNIGSTNDFIIMINR